MTSYVPAKKNTAFVFYLGLPSQGTPGTFQSNPTLAAGDAKVSIDGGALANLTTLPAVTPASSKMVKVSLSSTEMNGDNITVVLSDAAGSEWFDVIANIQTTARQIDDLAYPATSGRSMVVDASGLVDANTVKVGPSGSGTAQTAGDIVANETTIASYIDTEVAAIKAKTDSLTFTVAGQVDVNVVDWKGAAAPAMTGDAYARLGAPAGLSVSADIAAVNAKTTNLPSDPADESLIIAATDAIMSRLGAPAGLSVSADIAAVKVDTGNIYGKVDTEVAAIKAVTDLLPDAGALTSLATAASISALNNLSAAQVNAEVVDALSVDTYAEPGQGAPAATASLATKISFLFKAFRNKKTQTSTTFSLFADDATTVDQKATVSDDGTTFTSGEIATGP